MEQNVNTQHFESIVECENGRMFTTSLIVAEVFEKEHKDVLRAISNLECSQEFNERNFAPVEYRDAKGEMRPAYRLTRDGFSFLAMGFTGKKAAAWKEKFLEAFNAMEAALRERQAAPVEQTQTEEDVRNYVLNRCDADSLDEFATEKEMLKALFVLWGGVANHSLETGW